MKKITLLMALIMILACLTGCAAQKSEEAAEVLPAGGTLILSVNPEIAVEYDESGLVTGVTARNNDALAIIHSCTDLIGRETRSVVTDLVTAIGEAGYFVEEIEGEKRQITLEIESGSRLPSKDFLDQVVADVRDCIGRHDWSAPLNVENESDYGISDYRDTDYGPENDGATDYDTTDYGTTDYDVTDYGSSDYSATVPVDSNHGSSDYGNTDYGNRDYDASDYGTTDYGNTDYGNSDYQAPAAPPAPAAPAASSDYGNSGYSDYSDSGYSDYSDYGGSDYDD